MKVCSKCKSTKESICFSRDTRSIHGLQSKCKQCEKTYRDNNQEKIKLQQHTYYRENKEKILKNNKKYRIDNKDRLNTWIKEYNLINKEKIAEYHRKYQKTNKEKIKQTRLNNKEHINKRNRSYCKNKYLSDLQFKLKSNLRRRIVCAIKNNQKTGSAIRDLGCSIYELKQYLESKFQPGMSWDNYGKYGWHIDHIIPLSNFDLTKREDFLKACHYSNLQPLWAEDNLRKSNKVEGLDE